MRRRRMSASSLMSRRGSPSRAPGPRSHSGSGAAAGRGASHGGSALHHSCPLWDPPKTKRAWGRGFEVPGWARADGDPWWHPRSRTWPQTPSSRSWSAPRASCRSQKRFGTTSSCAGSLTTRNSAGNFLFQRKTKSESERSDINWWHPMLLLS